MMWACADRSAKSEVVGFHSSWGLRYLLCTTLVTKRILALFIRRISSKFTFFPIQTFPGVFWIPTTKWETGQPFMWMFWRRKRKPCHQDTSWTVSYQTQTEELPLDAFRSMVMKSKPKQSQRLIRTKEIIISDQSELGKIHVNVFSAGKRLIRCSFVSDWVREWRAFSRRQWARPRHWRYRTRDSPTSREEVCWRSGTNNE